MSNFLGEVLQAKGTASFEELNDTIRNLDGKISQLKINVVQTLNSTFVLFETDLDRLIQWFSEIVEIQEQLRSFEDKLLEDKQVLSSANQDLDTIQYDLGECQNSIAFLKSLVDVVRNFERADPIDYYNASQLLREAENELNGISYAFPSSEDHIWIKQLRARFSDLVVDVYDKCRKEWGNLFKFDKNCLTIYPHAVSIEQLIKSLKNVKSFNRLWEKFVNMVWQELFKPACSRDFKIEIHYPQSSTSNNYMKRELDDYPVRENSTHYNNSEVSFMSTVASTANNFGDDSRGAIVIRAIKLEKPHGNSRILFENLTDLVKTFYSIFSVSPEETRDLSSKIAPKINDELENKYLKSLILQRCGGDIEKARADLTYMSNFTQELSDNYNFNFPEENIFDHIEQNFDSLFRNQVREALIVKLRDLIKANVHNTTEINYEGISNSELPANEMILLRKNPYLFPRCVASQSIIEAVRLLKDHMDKYPEDIMMYTSFFSLYLALIKIPKHESDAGNLIPLTAVLIHNNSLFLAHHAGFTFKLCDDMVPNLRVNASQAIAFMMRSVRSNLNELISTAMSEIEGRVEKNIDITHDFLVLTAELKRLNSIMSEVLPSLSWHDILATLVDHTVNELCLKILAWDDIPESSASELANAFTQFSVATSNLFKGDASSPREVEALTSRAVKKWQRFKLVTFVLTASMKEIESKWVGGCGPLANEFTPEEVRRLVRALFQNTDRRAAFLSSIK